MKYYNQNIKTDWYGITLSKQKNIIIIKKYYFIFEISKVVWYDKIMLM